jgi:hypothetical protein
VLQAGEDRWKSRAARRGFSRASLIQV